MEHLTDDISLKLIPLPKQITCERICEVKYGQIKIESDFYEDVLVQSAYSKLVSLFGTSTDGGHSLAIKLKQAEKEHLELLKSYPNSQQAYHIYYDNALYITALQPYGIMNGVRTLMQAVEKSAVGFKIPILNVKDYPDIALRGQWGGDVVEDIEYISSLKLNAVDYVVSLGLDEHQAAYAKLAKEDIADICIKEGIQLTTYITHLEMVIKNHLDKEKHKHIIQEIKNVPSEEAASKNDYTPGICFSNKKARMLIYEWLRAAAQLENVNRIMVWLSEQSEPCMCSLCAGTSHFLLETDMLVELFAKLKQEFPNIQCEILLTQDSYSVNKQILERVPKDIVVVYYHGSKTYISDKNPMIEEDLQEFIQAGGKLGVYPQITNGWRSVFPWSAPDFIRFRCTEFVDKGLYKVIGYAVPANVYHAFNIAAMAEWLWNNKGRDEQQFMRAYAYRSNLDGEAFVKWCSDNMGPAWALAENRFTVGQMFNYPVIMKTRFNMEDFRLSDYSKTPIQDIEGCRKLVSDALSTAQEMSYIQGELESRCLLAMLRAVDSYNKFFKLLYKKTRLQEEDLQLTIMYERMHNAASEQYIYLLKWKQLMDPDNKKFSTRISDTAVFCMRIADTMRLLLVKYGIKHREYKSLKYFSLGMWNEGQLKDGQAILEYDVSDICIKPGRYHVCFDYMDSKAGTDIMDISVMQNGVDIARVLYDAKEAVLKRINMYEPWYEVIMDIENVDTQCKKTLHIHIKGPQDKLVSCRGFVGIRRI